MAEYRAVGEQMPAWLGYDQMPFAVTTDTLAASLLLRLAFADIDTPTASDRQR